MWMGVYPESFMAPIRGDVGALVARIDRAAPEGDAHFKMGEAKPAIKDEAHGEAH
ncbi:MAG: NADH-quinone oxidoreductase subunit M, partial [Sphingomonadales bacterium]|nr:NADH-quinone oxidoreductase subunit M [Sphingomonadales bacterium]